MPDSDKTTQANQPIANILLCTTDKKKTKIITTVSRLIKILTKNTSSQS